MLQWEHSLSGDLLQFQPSQSSNANEIQTSSILMANKSRVITMYIMLPTVNNHQTAATDRGNNCSIMLIWMDDQWKCHELSVFCVIMILVDIAMQTN